MFELITQIIILVALFFFIRNVVLPFIPRAYFTWLGIIVLVAILIYALLDPGNRTIGIIWAILSFPLRPLGLVLILLAGSLRAGYRKGADGVLVLWATMILLIACLPLTAYLLTAQTEQRSVISAIENRGDDIEELRDVQAIVVLGEGTAPTNPTYRITTQISNTTDGVATSLLARLFYTSGLFNEQVSIGNNPNIIVSAGPQPELYREDVPTARDLTGFLVDLGVPQDVILLESEGVDARTSAVAVRQILDSLNGTSKVILVAPALSIRRATSAFENLGINVIPRPTDFYVFQLQRGPNLAILTDLIPSAEALVVTSRVVDEYLATIYYFLRGWLVDPLGL
jgi:uncharacterized SAM-binding protein YcdF (DUF218 family)